MLKLNKLYTTCDWEIQELISHCMVLPAEKGLDAALTILDKRIGDMCMDQSRGKFIREPEMGEHDYQAFSAICAQLMPFILFAENIGKLSEIDNRPTIRDIILRLDDAMQGRWNAYRTGKRDERTSHTKSVLKFLERELKRVENEFVLKEKQNRDPKTVHRKAGGSMGSHS